MDNTQTSETDKPTLNAKTDEHERFNAENYIATRLKHEMEYYDNRADGYRNRYLRYQTWIIILGAIIPIITVIDTSFTELSNWHIGSIASAIIAAIIAILAGVDKLQQTQSRWNIMRYCAQMLKREEMLYRNRIGDYDNTSDKDAKQLLVKRTEGILYYDIASTLQFSQKGSPKAADDEKKDATNASKTD